LGKNSVFSGKKSEFFEKKIDFFGKNPIFWEKRLFGRDFNQIIVPRLVASATAGFDSSSIFSLMVQKAKRVPVLVYIILVVPSLTFAL
jgi:hypothetical protein